MNPRNLDAMVRGYLEAAQWADAPEGSRARFSAAEREIARRVCAAFVQVCGPLADQAADCAGYDSAQFGRDFWFTRCGHGVGYWDRPELEMLAAFPLPMLADREGKPHEIPPLSSLGDALTLAANGSRGGWMSGFYGADLCPYRGWFYVEGSAEHWARGHRSPWGFWQSFNLKG